MLHFSRKSCILIFCLQSVPSISFLYEICNLWTKRFLFYFEIPFESKGRMFAELVAIFQRRFKPCYLYLSSKGCLEVCHNTLRVSLLASAHFLFFGVTSSTGYFWQQSLPESVCFSLLRQTGDSSLVREDLHKHGCNVLYHWGLS